MIRARERLRWLELSPVAVGKWPRAAGRLSRRRSRSAVLAGLAIFGLASFALNLAVDTARPEWRDPEYGHRIKELKPIAATADRRPLVVALGNSRSQMGFNPAGLGLDRTARVYNLSQAGCGPVHQVRNLDRLLADGVRPDFLLVEFLPPVLSNAGPVEEQFVAVQLSLADIGRIESYCTDPSVLRTAWLKTRLAPWYSYRLSLLSHGGAGGFLPWQARQDFYWKQMRDGGWMPYFFSVIPPARREEGLAKARGQYLPYFSNFKIAPTPERAYNELVDRCRALDIPVAFYIMPESPIFRSWYPPESRVILAAYYDRWRADGVPVFDASTWLDDETVFADGHHLMRSGSDAFSRRFGTECIGPWLQSMQRP